MDPRPPPPPINEASATAKLRLAEDAWNSRDPERMSLADVVSQLPVRDREATARHLMSVYFGLRVLAKAGMLQATLDDARRRALQTVPAD